MNKLVIGGFETYDVVSMKLALVDVETTGGKPSDDRVIDIGVVLVDDFKITGQWESLINPECSISTFITGITGIGDIHVAGAPTFKTIHEDLFSILEDRIFVAHNARFDYSFIKHEYLRLNKKFQAPHLCTVKLSHKLYPHHRRHNLDEIISRFNITIDQRHRALPDAKAIYYFIESCINEKTLPTVVEEMNKLIHHPAYPTNVSEDQIMNLPASPGVYIFYDSSGNPLYIGKSKNIRERVLSHFYDDVHSSSEMQVKQNVADIETISCAGELEALITESRLVKKMNPLFNKQLKNIQNYYSAILLTNEEGYITIAIQNQSTFSYQDRDSVVLISKSKRQLTSKIKQIVDEYNLCPKLCGIDSSKGACFSHHLDKCMGACISNESADDYNHRVQSAFVSKPIPTWPFPEPIVIHEYNQTLEMHAYHVVNEWVIQTTCKTSSDLTGSNTASPCTISLDELTIIKHHLFYRQIPYTTLSKIDE